MNTKQVIYMDKVTVDIDGRYFRRHFHTQYDKTDQLADLFLIFSNSDNHPQARYDTQLVILADEVRCELMEALLSENKELVNNAKRVFDNAYFYA